MGDSSLYQDRTVETTTVVGTGTLTLLGAKTGYQSFSTSCVDGSRINYCITNGTDWEVGTGIFTLSGTTLTRDRVFDSSNAQALVSFSAGTKDVFVDQPADSICDVGRTYSFAMHTVPR